MDKVNPSHLRLVETAPARKSISAGDFKTALTQGTLFASQHPALLVFVDFEGLMEADLKALISNAQPRYILDLRLVPRFDVGSMNRNLMFAEFGAVGVKYFDVAGMLGSKEMSEIRQDASALATALKKVVFGRRHPPFGPVLLFSDKTHLESAFIEKFASEIDELAEGGWELMRVPEIQTQAIPQERDTIFICHATPDDNDFAKWLGSQLELAGYKIWVDFDRLNAGEVFWDTIEEVIRKKATKVLIVASRLAQTRNGVLDEINLAISVERSLGLENFVIPLRIDDLAYDQFRANISRKNITNFTGNWAVGLSSLLKTLDHDNVIRATVQGGSSIARVFHNRIHEGDEIEETSETLVLNWLEVSVLPKAIYLYDLLGAPGKVSAFSKTLKVPHAQYGEAIVTFCSPTRLQGILPIGISARRKASLLTNEFLQGSVPELPNLSRAEARKMLSNILRQGWDNMARSKRLEPYQLASTNIAWFLPNKNIDNNTVAFIGADGRKRRKSLVGFSRKRSVYWHFAMEVRLAADLPLRMIARPHVVFSDDGKIPLNSVPKMHALRRGFCRSWWNDRWRDLSVAYMVHLGNEREIIELNMGGDEIVAVRDRFETVNFPISPRTRDVEVNSDIGEADEVEPYDVDIQDDELEYAASETNEAQSPPEV